MNDEVEWKREVKRLVHNSLEIYFRALLSKKKIQHRKEETTREKPRLSVYLLGTCKAIMEIPLTAIFARCANNV